MPLTDTQCKNAKPKGKLYKLADSGGLYLQVMPNGSKYWRFKYRLHNKEKVLALGIYPLVALATARIKRDEAKLQVSEAIDPVIAKKRLRRQKAFEAHNTFKEVALEWHKNQVGRWSESHAKCVLHRLETNVFPEIGDEPISDIDTLDLLDVLKKIESRNALDMARRIRQISGQVFQYAVLIGKCKSNPATNLNGALRTRRKVHFAAIETREIPELLSALERNDVRLFARTRRALKLSLLTFVRPGELRKSKWSEFDFDKAQWRIPAERMKGRIEHLVPLSQQSIEILKEQRKETGNLESGLVFPTQTNPNHPMSENTICVALNNLGFKGRMTAHGFRALARTTIREELRYAPDVIEVQLAHTPSGSLGAAYDRSKFIAERKVMMQDWADFVDKIYANSKAIVALKQKE